MISNLSKTPASDGSDNPFYCDFASIFGRGEPVEESEELDDWNLSNVYGAFEGIKDDKLNDFLYDQIQKYIEETDHKNIEKYLKKLYKKKVSVSDETAAKKLKYPKIYEYINKLIIKTDAKSPAEFLELVPIDYSKFLDSKTQKILNQKKTISNVDKKVEELIIKLDKDKKLNSEQRDKLISKLSVSANKHRKFKSSIKKISSKELKAMSLDIDILTFNEIAQAAVIKELESSKASSSVDSKVYWWTLPWWKRPIYYYYWTDYEKLFKDAEIRRNIDEIKRMLVASATSGVASATSGVASATSGVASATPATPVSPGVASADRYVLAAPGAASGVAPTSTTPASAPAITDKYVIAPSVPTNPTGPVSNYTPPPDVSKYDSAASPLKARYDSAASPLNTPLRKYDVLNHSSERTGTNIESPPFDPSIFADATNQTSDKWHCNDCGAEHRAIPGKKNCCPFKEDDF